MKFVSLFTRVAIGAAAASALAVLSNLHAGAAYSIATGAFLLLIVVHDYSPRRHWLSRRPAPQGTPPRRSAQPLRLAA